MLWSAVKQGMSLNVHVSVYVYLYVCVCIRLKVNYKMSTVSVRGFYTFFLFTLKLYVRITCGSKRMNKIRIPKTYLWRFSFSGDWISSMLKSLYKWFWYNAYTQCKAFALCEMIPDYLIVVLTCSIFDG